MIDVPPGARSRVTWQINAERLVLSGWSRAILLQLAHPLVAAGVAQHSSFRDSPLTTVRRLRQTVHAMLALSFGDDAAAARTIAHIRSIHERVHGHLMEAVGRFPAGTSYSAEDPELLLWVHATLVESTLMTHDLLVRRLSDRERDVYCAESASVAIALGAIAARMPRTWTELQEYFERMYASGSIAVGQDARRLSAAILFPPGSWLLGPVPWGHRVFTLGVLPPDIRRQYGYRWSPARARQLRVLTAVARAMRRTLPARVALWPEARRVGLPDDDPGGRSRLGAMRAGGSGEST